MLLDSLSRRVLAKMNCRQEQLGVTVIIKCPPDNHLRLSHCCNDNGKIVCCSYEDYIHREKGQSDEAVVLLVAAGLIVIIIVTALCYIRWHSNFSKSNSSEPSDTSTNNSQPITSARNNNQDNLSSQTTAQRAARPCRYAEVLKSILEEDQKKIASPKKYAKKQLTRMK